MPDAPAPTPAPSASRVPVIAAVMVGAALAIGAAVSIGGRDSAAVSRADAGTKPSSNGIPEFCLPCGCHCTDQSEP